MLRIDERFCVERRKVERLPEAFDLNLEPERVYTPFVESLFE